MAPAGEADEVGIGHLRDLGGGDELGVEALGQGAEGREDALHVHDDGLAGAGQHHVLLLQEVAGHGDAVAHGHLVGGAANARHVDALGAHFLGQGHHLGVLGVEHDHLGQRRIMAVHDDVDHVLFHDAQVGVGVHGLGGAEQHVGQLGAHHGAAPAVGQAGAQGLAHQGLGLGGATHVGHVHGLGDFAVDGAGLDLGVVPLLLAGLRGALQEALHAEGLAVLQQADLGDLMGDVVDIAALGLDIPFLGDADQLLGVLDLIVAALLGAVQRVGDAAAVVGVGGGAAGGEAQVVAADDAVAVAATDATGGLRGDAAGAHGADTAADALLAELTVRGLVLDALLPGVRADLCCGFQQSIGRRFHLFKSDEGVGDLAQCYFLPKHCSLGKTGAVRGRSVTVGLRRPQGCSKLSG